jgi:serine/threonine-protein kinase
MAPQKIDRYEIKYQIGLGGMATVYLAYDPQVKRNVAIKLLTGQLLHDPEARALFEDEAERIASLEHPAIVPVYDFGKHEEQPFVVMRYMPGGSLFDRLRQAGGAGLPMADVAEILSRVSEALDFAHDKKIVHRDLKPGNILLDDGGKAYLSDFGIAKIIRTTMVSSSLTMVGTPDYMAPEQTSPGEKVTPQTDVYALGVTAFELLTGKLPFKAEAPVALLYMHVHEPVPRLADFAPGLPSGLQAVVERAMAKGAC